VNGNGVWDAGDVQLSVNKTFVGGTLTFTAINYNIVAGTPLNAVITFDITRRATNRQHRWAFGRPSWSIGKHARADGCILPGRPDTLIHVIAGRRVIDYGYRQGARDVSKSTTIQ